MATDVAAAALHIRLGFHRCSPFLKICFSITPSAAGSPNARSRSVAKLDRFVCNARFDVGLGSHVASPFWFVGLG